MRKYIIIGLFLSVAVFGVSIHGTSADRSSPRIARALPNQYIVVLKDGMDAPENVAQDIRAKHNFRVGVIYGKALRGFSATISDVDLEKIKNDPRVDFISPDYEVSIDAQILPTGINRINAEPSLPHTTTGAGVQVAVIDTGIYLTHPDLKTNILGGKNCSTGSSKNYRDGNGHGTHVAGTIAAINNGVGVVGVAPGAKLWSVRVLNNSGSGSWSSVICGIDFVTSKAPANGGSITVANMSLGGFGVSDNNCGKTNNDALHKAICRSRDAGVTYVVAAGNDGINADSQVPAAYDDAVITVSALADSDGTGGGTGAITSYGPDDTFASFSNYGSVVDIGAPGVKIYSAWKGGTYNTISGTSMASPHVAGAAALYIAKNPGASWTTVRDALKQTAEALGLGHSDPSGLHTEPILRADSL